MIHHCTKLTAPILLLNDILKAPFIGICTAMPTATSITVETLPPKREVLSPPPHHVGSPPISFAKPWPSFHKNTPLQVFIASRTNRNFQPVPSTRENLVKIRSPDWGGGNSQLALKATWIGHASFLIETPTEPNSTRGVRIFFDPVFSERTSPVSWAGPKRYTPTPCLLEEVPEIDLVVISHDHYDHMDSDTLRKIHNRRMHNVHFVVPLGNVSRLVGFGIAEKNVTQLDWWQRVHITVPGVGSIILTCTPSQHFSGRGLLDQCPTLWSSWVLETDGDKFKKRVFFAGDTGYRYVPEGAKDEDVPCCPVFEEIATTFGNFDLSLLPIGLYSPRHICSPVHCNPEDAVCLHKLLRSKKTIGMHYGTVRGGLSQYFEEVTEPPRRFQEAAE